MKCVQNICKVAAIVRLAIILFTVIVLLPALGCQHTPDSSELAQQNTLNSERAQMETKIQDLQNTIRQDQVQQADLQGKLAQQQAVIEDLSKSPKNAPWWQRFLDWLSQTTVGKWLADTLVKYIGEFLGLIGL